VKAETDQAAAAPQDAVEAAATVAQGAARTATTDPRLVAPALLAWLCAVLAVVPPRPVAVWLGLAGVAAGGVALACRRGGVIGLALVACGAVALSAGTQGLMAERSPLFRAAAIEARVTTQLRVTGEPKQLASDLGGSGLLVLEGQADGVAVVAFVAADQVPPVDQTRQLGQVDQTGQLGQVDQAGQAESARQVDQAKAAMQTGHSGQAIRAGHLVTLRATAGLSERWDTARVMLRQATVLDLVEPVGWRGVVFELREGLRRQSQALPADAVGLLPGITVGDRSGLAADLDEAMKVTSLTHITAVSGMHVAIVLGTVVGLLGLLGVPRLGRGVAGSLVLVGFVALVGAEPSVLRATLMGVVSLMALVSGRVRATLGALCAAVVILVVVDPFLARSYGLVLSVVATAALITLASPLGRVLGKAMPARLAQAVALPMAAQLATAPIVVIFAGRVSMVGVGANLLAIPAVPVATVGGLFACLVGGAPTLATLGLWPGGLAAWWVAQVARLGARAPMASLTWPDGARGALALVGMIVGLIAIAWWAKRLGRSGRVGLITILVVLVTLAGPVGRQVGRLGSRAPPAEWLVAVCDVGQGTAVAIRAGPDAAVLVDAGPDGAAVASCLDSLGVRRLVAVVITHFHSDHVAGLAGAVEGRTWETLVHGEPCGDTAAADQAEVLAAKAGAQSLTIPSDRRIIQAVAGNAELWLVPSRLTSQCPDGSMAHADQRGWDARGEDSASNNAGLTVFALVGGLAVWQPGDLEEAGQEALFWDSAALRGEQATTGGLVVIAHHGSARQSVRLAEALLPTLAVFSVGADNPYGHPNAAALALYASASQWRTDQCGTVVVSGSPGELVVSSNGCPQ